MTGSRRSRTAALGALVVAVAGVVVAAPGGAHASSFEGAGCYPSDGCEEPLAVEVEAIGGYGVTYPWLLEKEVDRTRVDVDPGGEATFTYTVTVRAGATVPREWSVSGAVLVHNPNSHDVGLTDLDITTDLGGGGTCLPSEGPWVVPAGTSDDPAVLEVPFSCSFTGDPAISGDVDATVTWEPSDENGPAVAEGADTITFTQGQETDEVVDVVDDQTVPGQRILLEEDLGWAPGLVKVYTYSLSFPGPAAGACATHTNTATIDLTAAPDLMDSASVQVCTSVPPAPPAPPAPLAPPVPPAPPAMVPPVVVPPVVVPAPEVLPDQASGRAVGRVWATCQGTVRARLANRSTARVEYTIHVGARTHHVWVRAGGRKTFTTHGAPRQRVVLRARNQVLDRVRVPHRCATPEVLPQTGLKASTAPRAAIVHRGR